jgi:RNA polymerase sigma-70 factor, ECF subfamily
MVSMVHAGAQVLRVPRIEEQAAEAVESKQAEFERVALPYSRSLLRVALRLTYNSVIAEDLVQETFLLAWRSFHQFQRGTNARAWLFRILFNAHYGQGRKLRAMPQIVSLDSENGEAAPFVSDGKPPVEAAEVSEALGRLSQEHCTVLLLGVVEGFTCQEISGILSVPIGTVMSRLSRARQALRAQLSPAVSNLRAATEPRARCAQKEAS